MRRSEPWRCDRRTLGGIGIASMDDGHDSKTLVERTGGEERINRETRFRTRRRTSTPVLVQPAVLLVAPDERGGGPDQLCPSNPVPDRLMNRRTPTQEEPRIDPSRTGNGADPCRPEGMKDTAGPRPGIARRPRLRAIHPFAHVGFRGLNHPANLRRFMANAGNHFPRNPA